MNKKSATNKVAGAYTLGRAAYRIRNQHEKYDTDNRLLIDKFGFMYDKTNYFIKKQLDITTNIKFFKEFTYPGFHIFIGFLPVETFSSLHFHIDSSIINFFKDVSIQSIYSFSSLIAAPTGCAYLEYKKGNELKIFEYQLGMLNLWKATVKHRLGCLELKDNQYRITYQGHVVKYKNDFFMYF